MLLMFCLPPRDLNKYFDEFLDSVLPSVKIGKSRLRFRFNEHEFRKLQDYLEGTFMLNPKRIKQIIEELKGTQESKKESKLKDTIAAP